MDKILKFFDEENFTALEGHLQKLSPAELCSCFKTCIRKQIEETPKLLTAIFKGLPCTTSENAKRREAIYSATIRLLQKGDTSSFTTTKLIGTLLLETRFFPPDSLANLSELFIESFKSGECSPGKWLECFPQLLSCLSTYEKVPYVDGHMTGEEYKSHVVNTICSSRWPTSMIVSLVTVFKGLTLSPDELDHVFDKILRTLRDVEYDSIPPLVYQTLVLSLKGHKRLVLEGLINFFNEEEAKCRQINAAPQETDLNSVEESCKWEELHRCEGTVLLHTLFAIKFDSDLGEELTSILKANRCLPERVISPFILCLSLCIASESQFQQRVFDCLRATILHSNKEKTLRKNSSWARAVVTSEHDVDKIISQTISVSAKGWDHVTQGLVQFGFTLVDFYGPKATSGNSSSPNIMACSVGSDIIFNVYTENRTVRETIVKEILQRIVPTNEPLLRQYLALLRKTIKLSHHPYFECISKIKQMLDYIVYLPPFAAFDLLKSIMPLLAANSSLRDAVIILLHKAMFWRKVEGRKIAVSGFLSCLKHFRIMGALPNSQGSPSTGTSQFSADIHMPMQNKANETLCLEVLGMLRRAFTQQADVRLLLYQGFPAIISASPYLVDGVLDLLKIQASLVIEPGDEPPLKLEKCYKIQGSEIVYLEPVPHLLGCIRNCVEIAKARVSESESEDIFDSEVWNHSLLPLMDKLTAAMIDVELESFELDKVADYNLTTSVGAKNYLVATIVMGVYEALIEYSFMKSTEYSTTMAENVLHLYERHSKITGMVKGKPGKGKAKKKKDEKISICGLTVGTVLTSRFITTIMKALFLDNLPENQEALSELRQHPEFQLYLQTIAVQKIAQIQDTGSFEGEERTPEELFQYCCTVGKLFFYRFTTELVMGSNKRASENAITLKCLEGFAATVAVIDDKFREKMSAFLSSLLKERAHTSASQAAEIGEASLCNVLKRVQRLIVKTLSTEEDATKYKEVAPLIKVLSILLDHLPTSSPVFVEVLEWADQLCKEKSVDDLPTVKALLSLLLKLSSQTTVHLKIQKQLAEDVYKILGDLEESQTENSDAVTYSLVNVETASPVVVIILEHLDKFLSSVEWFITGLKSRFAAKDPETIDVDVRVLKEKGICSALGETTACLHQILLTLIPAGPIVESVMLRLSRLYAVLGEFTKYYVQITTTGQQICARYQKLVMLVQDSMTRQVYSFMAYYQQPNVQEAGRSKKRVIGTLASKTMKESKVNAQAVFNIENFDALIIKLAAKTKNKKLSEKIKPSTNRDFRLDCRAIKEALARRALEDSDDEQNHTTEVDETVIPENEPEKTSQNSIVSEAKRRRLGGLNSRKGKKFLAPTTSHI